MISGFWQDIVSSGLAFPEGEPLDDLTAELTAMLGDPDPRVRDGVAYPVLATWIGDGVYDDLLVGLGDGIGSGLAIDLGESGTDSVFRRSFSALVLAECIDRDNQRSLLPATALLRWGDLISSWYLRERDLRGFVDGKGWAHTVAHGADCIAALARSPHLGRLELTVLLDVLGDRLLLATKEFFVCGEVDRLALATMQVLRRSLLGLDLVERWINRLADGAALDGDQDHNPFEVAGNVQAFLRALQLQLALHPEHPELRTDLLLVLIDRLRATNRWYLTRSDPSAAED